MTDREKAIVMAYTGVCMLSGDKFVIFHKYVEEIMGRPVFTHEFGIKKISNEIKQRAKADFLELCADKQSEALVSSDDCISRQGTLDCIKEIAEYHTGDAFNAARICRAIRSLPPAAVDM